MSPTRSAGRPARSRRASCAPAKRTSSGFSARSSLGESEPAAQRIASATFDFPEPFGPTMTPTPGSRRTSTVSGKDLKPRSFMARRCTPRRLPGLPAGGPLGDGATRLGGDHQAIEGRRERRERCSRCDRGRTSAPRERLPGACDPVPRWAAERSASRSGSRSSGSSASWNSSRIPRSSRSSCSSSSTCCSLSSEFVGRRSVIRGGCQIRGRARASRAPRGRPPARPPSSTSPRRRPAARRRRAPRT